ncbi:MAG: hypothetical protein AAFV80_20810, partial [Bacteroidota bacterium]
SRNVLDAWPEPYQPDFVLIRSANTHYLDQLRHTFPTSTWIVDGQLKTWDQRKVLDIAQQLGQSVHHTETDKALLLKIPLNPQKPYKIIAH